MNPWQRLVGTRDQPRRVANPGVVFLAFVLAVLSLALGLSALIDGRNVQGGIQILLAVSFMGWA